MTSSQPVTSPDSVFFTPDNLRVYAYSGPTGVADSEINLIQFNTNTEYMVGTWTYQGFSSTGDDYRFLVRLNDTRVSVIIFPGIPNVTGIVQMNTDILIPPFTAVRFTAQNITDSTSNDVGVIFTGRAFGMTKTEYQ